VIYLTQKEYRAEIMLFNSPLEKHETQCSKAVYA